jgi:ADP-heptose:LPS heptosyltransferase
LHAWPDLDLMQDLDGVAALIAGLDLVVTAATSMGEMAAALGVPVWRLAPGRDWTHLGTAVRPWYPAMRVITPLPGQPYAAVVDTVRTSLAALR